MKQPGREGRAGLAGTSVRALEGGGRKCKLIPQDKEAEASCVVWDLAMIKVSDSQTGGSLGLKRKRAWLIGVQVLHGHPSVRGDAALDLSLGLARHYLMPCFPHLQ